MRAIVIRKVIELASKVNTKVLQGLLPHLAATHASRLEPADALRFLLDLEYALYPVIGHQAVRYGGGVHVKHRLTNYHDFFISRMQAGERVIDIGCGIGALSFDLADKAGVGVVGIDIDPINIQFARDRFRHPNVEYHSGDASKINLALGRFDVVVLSNVLEHIQTRSDFLKQVGGATGSRRFLIRVPLFERDWRVPARKELGIEWRLDLTHFTEYTLESFKDETTHAGLRITYMEVRWGEIWAELEHMP